MCHFEVADIISGHLASMLLIVRDLLAGFLIALLQNGPFAPNSFFWSKTIAKVRSYYKNKECNHCVFLFSSFLFSSLFLFLLSFSFFTVILELLRLKKPAFWHLFTQITANFVRLVFKKFALNIHTYKHIYIQDGGKVDGIGHRQPSLVMYLTWISQASQQ